MLAEPVLASPNPRVRVGPLRGRLETLYPGYFALVMATGIVSIACYQENLVWAAWALLGINVAAYAGLGVAYGIRLALYPGPMWRDLKSHARGPGFFTLVAGTCVLSRQLSALFGSVPAALYLWMLGVGLWSFLIYAFFALVTIQESKPPLEQGVNGSWLIAVVATQSVAVAGTGVASQFVAATGWFSVPEVLFFSLGMYLLGCMLYLLIIVLIFFRFSFFALSSSEMTPPYWINMGAVAITTLAGATLMVNAADFSFLQNIYPFLAGFTLFFWATGSWWIPLLFLFGVWRHFYKGQPLRYDPQMWGMVFPLGMYSASTYVLSEATGLDFLSSIPSWFVYVALGGWLLVGAGMLFEWARYLRGAAGAAG